MTDEHALPPEPEQRSITPAPEDFGQPMSLATWGWPLLWFGVATAIGVIVHAAGWPLFGL